MIRDAELRRAIDLIYDAAADAGAWQPALTSLCDAVSAEHAIAFAFDSALSANRLAASARMDPVHHARFTEALGGPIDWFDAIPQARGVDFQIVIPREQFVRTDFFHDIVRPAGGYRALCCIPLRGDGLTSYVALCRSQRAHDFEAEETAVLDRVAPHLGRAMRAGLRSDETRRRAQAALEVFDRLDFGVVIVDADLTPVVQNRRAQQAIQRRDGLLISRRTLLAGNTAETRLLGDLVRRAAADDPRAPGRYAMRLSRAAPQPPWIAVMSLMAADVLPASRGPLVIITLEGAAGHLVDVAGMLVSLFALTPREAALAMELARGQDLAAAADRLRIAYETARGYLKSIFLKTATHRQAELVALILRLNRFGG
jgi:DNA-binding CsgD family transcriptional regulator